MDVAAIGNPTAMIISIPDGLALLPKQSYVIRERIIFLGLKPSVQSFHHHHHVPEGLGVFPVP